MARWGMVIDLSRCIGCYGCQMSCKAENATLPGMLWARLELQDIGQYPLVRRIPLPLLCMHCKNPECEKVCPTGATRKREDGIVEVISEDCIGCKACQLACPYGARYMHEELKSYFPAGLTPYEKKGYPRHTLGTMTKCDFCKERVDRGLAENLRPGVDREATPACAINCMCKARFFGDLDDPTSEVAKMVAQGLAFQIGPSEISDPQVYYLPPGGGIYL